MASSAKCLRGSVANVKLLVSGKRAGASEEPWGTPAFTENDWDGTSAARTQMVRLLRKRYPRNENRMEPKWWHFRLQVFILNSIKSFTSHAIAVCYCWSTFNIVLWRRSKREWINLTRIRIIERQHEAQDRCDIDERPDGGVEFATRSSSQEPQEKERCLKQIN